jgi:predicted membrane protein
MALTRPILTEPDHDRLVRIEEALGHLSDNLKIHTEELRQHIKDETLDFTDLKSKLVLHLQESESMMQDVSQLKKDVSSLKYERVRIIGWVAGVIFVVGIGWTFLSIYLDHAPK